MRRVGVVVTLFAASRARTEKRRSPWPTRSVQVDVLPVRAQVTEPAFTLVGHWKTLLLNSQISSVAESVMSSVASALTVIVESCGSVAPSAGDVIITIGGFGSFGGGGGGMPVLVPSFSISTCTLFCEGRPQLQLRA